MAVISDNACIRLKILLKFNLQQVIEIQKSKPRNWAEFKKREQNKDGVKRERSSSSFSSSSETPETEEDYLKLIEKKSSISIDRTERKGEWLTKGQRCVQFSIYHMIHVPLDLNYSNQVCRDQTKGALADWPCPVASVVRLWEYSQFLGF